MAALQLVCAQSAPLCSLTTLNKIIPLLHPPDLPYPASCFSIVVIATQHANTFTCQVLSLPLERNLNMSKSLFCSLLYPWNLKPFLNGADTCV